MTNLELLKEGNPPAELSKFQSKFRNNYDEDKQILRSGRNDSQEIFLRRADQSSGLQNLFAKFLTDTVSYLEKRFASLSCPPLSDFSAFDHRSMPVQRGERASYGNKEVQRLTEHFAPPPLLTTEEKEGVMKEWQELKTLLAAQKALKPTDMYASLLAAKPGDLTNVLVLVELMIALSPTTATCERSFSE